MDCQVKIFTGCLSQILIGPLWIPWPIFWIINLIITYYYLLPAIENHPKFIVGSVAKIQFILEDIVASPIL